MLTYIETAAHVFLHCYHFIDQCQPRLGSLSQIDHDMLELNENLLIDTLLCGNPKHNVLFNSEILMTSISYILSTKIFDGNLM